MSNAAPRMPSRSARIGAAAGVWYGWVTVATITASTCAASRPAEARASRVAASDMSTTDSSLAAKRRLLMPERSWIHWSEESIASTISELGTTRDGR